MQASYVDLVGFEVTVVVHGEKGVLIGTLEVEGPNDEEFFICSDEARPRLLVDEIKEISRRTIVLKTGSLKGNG